VEWILENINQVSWWRYVISKTSNRGRMSSHIIFLPFTKKRNNEVSFEFLVKDLREEIEI
jgi:hypothetical protein